MNSMQRQLNHLFDDALTPANWDDFSNFSKIPTAELTETDDALHLKLEVPGMEAKDLDIQVMADRVAISPSGQGECPVRRLATTGDAYASRASLRR